MVIKGPNIDSTTGPILACQTAEVYLRKVKDQFNGSFWGLHMHLDIH